MKNDKLEYAYVILDKDHEITDESGDSDGTPTFYIDEASTLNGIRHIYRNDSEEEGPFYIGKVTLVSRVYPPTDLKIEKL